MKKILTIILLFIMSITVFGCTSKEVSYNRNEIVSIIDEFGIEYEDDDFDVDLMGQISGSSDLLVSYDDAQIGLVIYQEHLLGCIGDCEEQLLYVTFYFNPYADITRNECALWDVEIIYVNFDTEMSIHLDYYYYDSLTHDNFEDQILDYSFNEFLGMIREFSLVDWKYIISELGYPDIVE